MSKPGKVLRNLCKRLGVRLTVKRGKKRVYKSIAVLKRQCANKKKKTKVKRKRKFGMAPPPIRLQKAETTRNKASTVLNIPGLRRNITGYMGEMNKNTSIKKMEPNVQQILKALEEGRVVRAPGAYLRGANLNEPIIQRDNPNGAIVQWANIEGTILRNIEDSSFIGLEQDGIRFIYGNLSGADFNGADLRGANLSNISFHRVNFNGANLKGAHMPGCEFLECSFVGANLQGAILGSSYFGDANIHSRSLYRSYVEQDNSSRPTDLRGANLEGARMVFTNIRKANLEGANLKGVDLRGAYLIEQPNLQGADLEGADLRNTWLREVNLEGVNLEGAIYDHRTKFPRGFNKTNPFHGLIYSESRFGKKKRRKVKKKKKSKK